MSQKPVFVWVRGTGGKPVAQKWQSLDIGRGVNSKQKRDLLSYEISDGAFRNMTIDELSALYPAPPQSAIE